MNQLTLVFLSLLFILVSCQAPVKEKGEQVNQAYTVLLDTLSSPVQSSIRGISVPDANIAWLSGAGGTILKTENSGKQWELVHSPDEDSLDYRSIHAFDAKKAIVVSAGFPARVYKTIDSGNSWKLVYENNDSAAFLNSIAFKNEREGIIMGDQLKGRHVILRTGNGGDSWKRIDSIDVPKPLKIENAFAASGSCIAVSNTGRFFIGFGGKQTRVFSSVNGYKWKAKSTPMYHGSASSGIYSIASSGTGKIMAVGGDYTKADSSHFPIISINDGKSWLKTKGKVSGYRSVVDYSKNGKLWLAAGTNGIDISFDDGKTWEKISNSDINTLQFIPNTTGAYLATKEGSIFFLDIQTTNSKD